MFDPFLCAISSQISQTFRKVVVTAKHLKHPNLVPLLGVTVEPPQLISDRMPGGNLLVYLGNHSDADRISLVCFYLVTLHGALTSFAVSYPVSPMVSTTYILAMWFMEIYTECVIVLGLVDSYTYCHFSSQTSSWTGPAMH